MKLMAKLLTSFIGIALLVLIAGVMGIYSANKISGNTDLILDEKVPMKDVALEAISAITTTRNASGEYLLNNDGLEEIEDRLTESLEDFDMWMAMIEYGTESSEFQESDAGEMYRHDGLTIVAQKGTPAIQAIAATVETYHSDLGEHALALMASHQQSLKYDVVHDDQRFDINYWILQKEVDHLRWVEEMSEAIAEEREFLAEVDPTQCSFGQWFYSYDVDDPLLMKILKKVESPHEELHHLGEKINATDDKPQRQAIHDNEVIPTLNAIKTVFREFSAYVMPVITDARNNTQAHMDSLETAALQSMTGLDSLKELANSDMNDAVAEAHRTKATVLAVLIAIVVVGLSVAILVGIVLSLRISRPLQAATKLARKLASGDFRIEKLQVKTKDEIAELADSFGEMLDSLQYKAEIIERIADGDLTTIIQKASEDDGLGESLIKMNNSLNVLLNQVSESIEQVASGSDQVSQSGQTLSQGATEQASSLEEISSSVTEIAHQSKSNVDSAEAGTRQMQELLGAMEKISASSNEITKIVKVIDDIAFQINLLALNANVEAARAGKYGSGFAVVADEVRNLAVRSAEAVKETTQMVQETVSSIQTGNELAEATAKQLEEMASASTEQAEGVEQINGGLEQIDLVTQSNTASAEESASAAEELAAQAQQLKETIARFKLANSDTCSNGQVRSTPMINVDPNSREPVVPHTSMSSSTNHTRDSEQGKAIKLDDENFGKF